MSSSLRQTRKGVFVNLRWVRFGAGIALALCLCVLLTGCGKRPSKISPPEGVSEAETVRVYPDPALDPLPVPDEPPPVPSGEGAP